MRTLSTTIAWTMIMASALTAQQTAPAPTPPPAAPRIVEGQDMRARQLREMAMVDERRAAGDPLERYLIPPEVIMRRQREIGLQPAQRTQITQAIGRLEAALVELQWTMQDQQQALAEMLQQPQVNTEAALQALDRVLTTETAVKRAHFQALLQIRNVLTSEQLDRLRLARTVPDGAVVREDER